MCPYHEMDSAHTMTWLEVQSNLEFVHQNVEFGRFDLSGGEPTIYKYFFDILDWFKDNLPKTIVYIHTNGVKFADESFVKRMSGYNVTCYVSFHNPDEETSRIITRRKNHYQLLLAGLENLKKYNIATEATVVLTKQNQDRLDEINRELSRFPIQYLTYRLPYLIKMEGMNIYKPDIIGLVEKVREAQTSLKIRGRVNLGYFPDCFLGQERLAHRGVGHLIVFIDKLHQLDNAGVGTNFSAAISEEKYYSGFVKEEQCSKCTFDKYCRGISREYLQDMHKQGFCLAPVEV